MSTQELDIKIRKDVENEFKTKTQEKMTQKAIKIWRKTLSKNFCVTVFRIISRTEAYDSADRIAKDLSAWNNETQIPEQDSKIDSRS